MSTFQENFKRDEQEKLTFDDTAFYFFSFAMLFVLLAPATIYLLIKPIFFGDLVIKEKSIKNC